MGDMSHEPSMEEILSSIKKIIADDGDKPMNIPRLRRSGARTEPAEAPESSGEIDVLELTDAVNEAEELPEVAVEAEPILAVRSTPSPAPAPQPEPTKMTDTPILAEKSVSETRNAFAQLTTAKAKPKVAIEASPRDNAIEALVVDALRPMLKEWLDANLPSVVERLVAKEIARMRED